MESWEKIVEIFEQAADLAPAERQDFLARVGLSESDRREVEELLAADLKASQFIESPAIAAAPTLIFGNDFLSTGSELFRRGVFRRQHPESRGGSGQFVLLTG